ncbi:MAG: LLM class flavin-dependent oxidoreductase [Actinobacteria bacterium]|nr:LLM class flavin-dependent oxidoreductase [Actinomycetota bacterium]
MTTLSFLDLAHISEGSNAGQALRNSRDLAVHAERLGFKRFWLAEHHNMPGIASAATSVAIGYVAEGTSTIRVGAGGVMLPNHAPLIIAEQFGTLASLYPDRIDLGLGRAPGTDQMTSRALRRTLAGDIDEYPQDVLELMAYLGDPAPGQRVHAVPGEGTKVPIYILGSSTYGAQLAAAFGLPYAFASHFAPADLDIALRLYRDRFKPSASLQQPYVIVGLNVTAAPTDEEARYLFTSTQQSFVNMRSGNAGQLPPPVDDIRSLYPSDWQPLVDEVADRSVVGSLDTVAAGIAAFAERTTADEIIVTSQVFDHAHRVRSLEITADAGTRLRDEALVASSRG